MIRLVLCDTGALSLASALKIVKSTPSISGVLSHGKNEDRLKRSAAAYIALSEIFKALGCGTLPRLLRNASGKPYGEDCRYSFSISHRNNIAVIAISDEGEVGADVEHCAEGKNIDAVAERFLPGASFDVAKSIVSELYFTRLLTDGTLSKLDKIAINDNNTLQLCALDPNLDGYTRWTALEATLKCAGDGFDGIARLGELLLRTAVSAFRMEYCGEKYTVSVAKKV